MAKVEINLDEKSLEILKAVDEIHRNSIVNIGLALVSKTGYYQTLTGKQQSELLEQIASLDIAPENDMATVKAPSASAKPKTTSWDSF